MDSHVLDLGDAWEMREAIGETWRWYVAPGAPSALNNVGGALDGATASPGWTLATVPGSVVDALARSGQIPDARRAWGSRFSEWTGRRSWVLRREVDLDNAWAGAHVVLEVDGIDPGGRVLWDGEELGRVTGLYATARFRVDIAHAGRHSVAIQLDPARSDVPQVGRTADVTHHAPRVNQGWDFCPPFPHQGVWRPVRLVRGVSIGALAVASRCLGDGGTVSVDLETDAPDGTDVLVTVEGVSVASQVSAGRAVLELSLDRVERWWPRGLGPQRLYDVDVALGGRRVRRRVGFREARWVTTPGSPEGAYAYGLEVNGTTVRLAGINWTPADAQFASVTRERLAHLLTLAAGAGARLIRVWGGGLVETDDFYDLADAYGLLAWQEFSQSSSGLQSAPSDDPAFVAALAEDARRLTAARAHHPSLVLWGGGNELEDDAGPLRTERSAALTALSDAVASSPGDAAWIPTSPSGPVFHHRLGMTDQELEKQHDVHGPWEYQGLAEHRMLASLGRALAHTEFGVEGMSNRRLHEHLVPAELREPASKHNPLYRHLGEWWNNEPQVQELFGGSLTLEELRRASQWLQTTGLAIALEADLRRWPRTSMVLPWQLNESYPNAWGTAVVGFDGEPKPAFGAVARAFAGERVTLVTPSTAWRAGPGRAEAWLWSDVGREAEGVLRLSALDQSGRVLATAQTRLDRVGDPVRALTLEAPPTEGLVIWRAVWTATDGSLVDDERIVETGGDDLAPLRSLPRTSLRVEPMGAHWRVTNTGQTAAIAWGPRDVRPAADARYLAIEHDPRPLMPGESQTIRPLAGTPAAHDVIVDAWNADAVPLPPLKEDTP